MKKLSILFLFCLLLLSFTNVNAQLTTNNAAEKEAKILELVFKTIKEEHINPKKIDDEFSKKMFKSYIDTLDVDKLFFLQSDILEFKKFELKLDDQIKNNNLSFLELTRKRYLQRMSESKEIYVKILKGQVDFSKDENWETDNKNLFCNTNKELEVRWTKFFKKTVIEFTRGDISENLSFEDFESETNNFYKQTLPNVLERSNYNVESINNEAVFTIFLNSFLLNFDPHTIYYSNPDYQKYVQSEIGVYNGFGFSFNQKNDFVTISNIDIGGPAWQTKKIEVGDVILKVAQEKEVALNVTGLNLYEVAKLTRGKAGTIVRLTVKKPNGSIIEMPIKRSIVSLNDSFIKSAVVIKNNLKFGILFFQRFYNELLEQELRISTNDFAKELEILKQNQVQGIIIDIRDNDGGNIEEVREILKDISLKIKNWNIVLLINSKTGSGAELFSVLFKEQNIGVLIGEQSKSSGSIQNFINLNTLKKDTEDYQDFGSVFVTTDNFKKASIPETGIIPDVNFTPKYKLNNFKKSQNLLPSFDKQTAKIDLYNKINSFKTVLNKSQIRLKKSVIYSYIINDSYNYDLLRINNLNYLNFKKEYDALLKKHVKSPLNDYSNNLNFNPIEDIEKTLQGKEYLLQKRKDWYKSLKKDYQIEEGINILEDLNNLKK